MPSLCLFWQTWVGGPLCCTSTDTISRGFFQKLPQVEGSRLNLETCIWVFYFHEESPCKFVSCVMQNPERKEREELSPGGLPGRPLKEPRVTVALQWRCPYIPAFHDHLSAGVNLHSVSQVPLSTQAFLHVATALLPLLCWLFLFYFIFETGFYCVGLVASKAQIHVPLSPDCWD